MRSEYTFTSSDGKTALYGVEYRPDAGAPKAVVQIVHGMCEYIGRYDRFMTLLSENGYVAVGHDHLGHGKSAKGPEDLGYFGENPSRLLVEDMELHRRRTQENWPGLPYFILGHSMGSYLLRMYLASHGKGLAGAIVMGTGFVPAPTARFGLAVVRFLTAIRGDRYRSPFVQNLSYDSSYKGFDVTGQVPEKSWLTRDTEIVRKYYSDPFCNYRFTLNGYRGLMEAVLFDALPANAEKIPKDLPILLISGDRDPVGGLGTGVEKVKDLYEKAGIRDLTIALLPEYRHEVLNETGREKTDAILLAWLDRRAEQVS